MFTAFIISLLMLVTGLLTLRTVKRRYVVNGYSVNKILIRFFFIYALCCMLFILLYKGIDSISRAYKLRLIAFGESVTDILIVACICYVFLAWLCIAGIVLRRFYKG